MSESAWYVTITTETGKEVESFRVRKPGAVGDWTAIDKALAEARHLAQQGNTDFEEE